MKRMYLIFNSSTENYIYYEQKEGEVIQKNRKELGLNKDLVGRLSFIDKKRNSVLIIKNIPKETLVRLENYFKNSKVNLLN